MKYSNCFIEAVKAKLRDPKNTHIIYVTPEINRGLWHFFWVKNDKVYQFEDLKGEEGRAFIFKGRYKEDDMDTFEAFILRSKLAKFSFSEAHKTEKIARRLYLPSINKEGYLKWSRYWPEEGVEDKPVENKICRLVMVKDKKGLKVMKIKDFDKKNFTGRIEWKYVSPYCQEWWLFSPSER